MRVKVALQIFSRSLASFMFGLAGGAVHETSIGPRQMPLTGQTTANCLGFFDKLADAFNGKISTDGSSNLRTLMNDDSFHIPFFREAAAEINRMRFVNRLTKEPIAQQPPSLKNLKTTIDGFILPWNKLKALGFRTLKTKNINQDPLENFFSLICDCGNCNRKPTCFQFIGFFKTLVINNLAQDHSSGANCEDEEGDFILTWKPYFQGDKESVECIAPVQPIKPKIIPTKYPIPERGTISTSTQYVLNNLKTKLPSTMSCPSCTALFTSTACLSNRKVGNKFISRMEKMHLDLKSLLRRVMNSIYTVVRVREITFQAIRKEVRTNTRCVPK